MPLLLCVKVCCVLNYDTPKVTRSWSSAVLGAIHYNFYSIKISEVRV